MAAKKINKAEAREIIYKCGKDPIFFLDNFAFIFHPMKGKIPFKLFDYQEEVLKDLVANRFNIILKARQLGMSTLAAGYIAWLVYFHRAKSVVVVATKRDKAANILKKVKVIIDNMPSWMQIAKKTTDNKYTLELSNGSQIIAESTSGDAARSEALSLLVIDEAAIIDDIDDLWTGAYPTLSTGGSCLALSTPKGVNTWFHITYSEAEEGKNDFNPIKLMWNVHPDRDEEWFEKETRNMKTKDIAQELCCNFNLSGDTVIDPKDIQWVKDNCKDPVTKTNYDKGYWIWERPDQGKRYVLVADPARGDSEDFCAIHVFDADTMEQVAEYHGKMPTDEFAQFIYNISGEYGFCLTAVENNNVGWAVVKKLIELEHPNLYCQRKGSGEYVNQMALKTDSSVVPGFSMNLKNRPLLISKFEEYIRHKVINVNSIRLANELDMFIWKNGKPQAQRSGHDDLIMSAAIACWVRDTAVLNSIKDKKYAEAILSSIKSSARLFENTTVGRELSGIKTLDQKKNEYLKHSWLLKG